MFVLYSMLFNQHCIIMRNSKLFEAVKAGDFNKVFLAVEEDADVNARDSENWMPLHYAAESGNEEIINFLIDNGADVNATNSVGFSPYQILMICEQYSPSIVNRLVNAGANVGTDLHKSILLRDADESRRFIESGLLIDAPDNLGNTPLHIAVAVDRKSVV